MKVFAPEFTKQTFCYIVRIELPNGNIQMEAFETFTPASQFYLATLKSINHE
jgi:hypothetical protein